MAPHQWQTKRGNWPEADTPVLIFIDGEVFEATYRPRSNTYQFPDGQGVDALTVLAWMPMPSPPELKELP